MSNQMFFQMGCGVASFTVLYGVGLCAVAYVRENASRFAWSYRFAREAVAYVLAIVLAGVR